MTRTAEPPAEQKQQPPDTDFKALQEHLKQASARTRFKRLAKASAERQARGEEAEIIELPNRKDES